MLNMHTTYQLKVDKKLFIEENWTKLFFAIEENCDYYEKKYRRQFRNTLLAMLGSLTIIFCIILMNYDTIDSFTIEMMLGGWLFIFIMGFVLDIIDFPYYYKKFKQCQEAEQPFFDIDICTVSLKELVELLKKNNIFEHKDYIKIKGLLYDLYFYETICKCKLIDYDSTKDEYLESLKYCDEDGIIYKSDKIYCPIRKSVNLKDGEYLLQMTEDGLVFVKPN